MSLAEAAIASVAPMAVQSLTRSTEPLALDDEGLERAFVDSQMALNRNAYAAPRDGLESTLLFALLGVMVGYYAAKKMG